MANYVQHVHLHARARVTILLVYLVMRTVIVHAVCQLIFGMVLIAVKWINNNFSTKCCNKLSMVSFFLKFLCSLTVIRVILHGTVTPEKDYRAPTLLMQLHILNACKINSTKNFVFIRPLISYN
jgi:hypothetical protein